MNDSDVLSEIPMEILREAKKHYQTSLLHMSNYERCKK
jgi:hypothetical protein